MGSDMINFSKTKTRYLLNILWRFHSFLFPQNIKELMNTDNIMVIVGGRAVEIEEGIEGINVDGENKVKIK